MSENERPKFSPDPRGGIYIDDGVNPITRVEDEPEPVAEEKPRTETPAEVA